MSTVGKFLFGSAIVASLCGGCYRASEATVNGDPVVKEDFYAALKLAQGHKMLQKLILQKLIFQEAARLNLSVADSEIASHIQDISKHTNDEDIARVLTDEVRSRILLRKILLKDVTEDRLRKLHELFADDLAQYQLYVLTTSSKHDADLVRAGLLKGEKFNLLAASHSKYKADRETGGLRGSFNRAQLRAAWGGDVADVIVALKPDKECIVAEYGGEYMVLAIGGVVSSYEELKPTLEELEANSRRPELVFRLFAKAQVTSPYLTDPKRLPATGLYDEMPLPWERDASFKVDPSKLGPANPSLPKMADGPTPSNVTTTPSPAPIKENDLQIE